METTMGRKSLISMTTINRLISASSRTSRERYNNKLINSQGGSEKEKPPKFYLNNVEFNINTRITRLEFIQTQEYRTIQRYITQNYVKHPIYTDWKLRSKCIKKTIKLTNSELESLNTNDDFLIRIFAEEIIIKLNNEELLPSWFINLYLTKEYDEKINLLNREYIIYKNNIKKSINLEINIINIQTKELEPFYKKLTKLQSNLAKNEIRLETLNLKRKNVYKSIFTFGIYSYLISERRKNKFYRKSAKLNFKINDLNYIIKQKENIIKNSNKKIESYNNLITEKEKEIKIKINSETASYKKHILKIKPLQNFMENDSSFKPLKLFSGLEYEKIIGCYVIHNKEKDKYYIGQSKDVMKRIKQHFKGTIPNNQIFAEDYYTSQFEKKENLFEIKIIKCETKDELDRTEKKLIYEYDSWNNGYNGTSGNI